MTENGVVEPEQAVKRARKPRRSAAISVDLHPRALAARKEALAALGDDAGRFAVAVERYVLAVEAADAAWRLWEELGRPLTTTYWAGETSHPLVGTWESLEKSAARFADALGLTPAAERRIRGGVVGRPPGAASAPDRKAPPPIVLRAVKGEKDAG